MEYLGIVVANTVAMATVAGTASELAGGKFGNGAMSGAFAYLYNELSEQSGEEAKRRLLGTVKGRGVNAEFATGNKIYIKALSHTQGMDGFYYKVTSYNHRLDGRLIPNLTPLGLFGNPVPEFEQTVTTGFGGGFPDRSYETSTCKFCSDQVLWRVTIPLQPIKNANSAGWELEVYEQK